MKKFAITTAAVLLGLAPWAQADEPAKTETPACKCCCKNSNCKSPCAKTDKGIQCGEQAWLDIETVTLEAANGDPIAQYTVAYLTEAGDDNTAPDADKASEWYKKSLPGLEKSAADGSISACLALAHMYAEGKGVEKNPEMVKKYKKMAKELWEKKRDEQKDAKPCCGEGPGPVQPEQN